MSRPPLRVIEGGGARPDQHALIVAPPPPPRWRISCALALAMPAAALLLAALTIGAIAGALFLLAGRISR
ncbi:hypothetical protein GCM10010964_43440 [Caldovatus sediminis]|uniref:Uncharacterized protein n=1 Tax=Caldovatus sediminis TaxID=2041189 RepID=A0A8J2ZFL9_9PROT|nr:hypothetical protein [Caldovatus sediminis]GGG51541.1 hypothetical protein GCM10010964_43440 [Caldovatus sediminis]